MLQQRLAIVQLYYENARTVENVFRALRSIYDQHNRLTERRSFARNQFYNIMVGLYLYNKA